MNPGINFVEDRNRVISAIYREPLVKAKGRRFSREWRRLVGTCWMTLWFVFALMTAAASFAVLWPLRHRDRQPSGGSEAAVYRDQLAEIDRDAAAGLIGPAEADAARVEISRRLLAAVDARRGPPAASSDLKWRRSVAVGALGGL